MTLADFINIMISDLRNECTHMHFYLYHASAVKGLHALEFKEFLTAAAKSEMQHVQQFLDRLFGLNASQLDTSPLSFVIADNPQTILEHACQLEGEVIRNYTQRLTQLEELAAAHPTEAAYLTIFYEDQIQDSYEDRERMLRMLAGM